MGMVSVRLDEEQEHYLRRRGLNMSRVLREALDEKIRRLQVDEQRAFLDSVSRKPKRPTAAILRELRDGR